MKKTTLLCLILIVLMLVSGCSRPHVDLPTPSLSFADSEMVFNVGDVILLALTKDGPLRELSFESSDDSVVSVTSDGVATAHSVGAAVITTHMGALSATLNVIVVMPRAIKIELTRNIFSIGDTVDFNVVDNYGTGEPYTVSVKLDSNPDIDAPDIVDNSFVVHAAGLYTITAVSGDAKTSVQFIVFDLELFVYETLDLANIEREKAGRVPLVFDDALINAATIRVMELPESFSHTRPNGAHFSTAFMEADVAAGDWAENLAMGQRTPEEVVKMWMESDSHRAALLDPDYKYTGIGIFMADDGRTYWAQTFSS